MFYTTASIAELEWIAAKKLSLIGLALKNRTNARHYRNRKPQRKDDMAEVFFQATLFVATKL
jgi:hypothetical protein